MKPSLRVGRVAGIEVGLHWSVAAIAALLAWSLAGSVLPDIAPGSSTAEYWIAGIVAAALFLGSILAHELSHSLVAVRAGVAVDSITLWAFGGVAALHSQPRDARTELKIAIAGPAASVGAAVVALGSALLCSAIGAPDLVVASLRWVGGINAAVVVFNLLPGAPLDGGRVLTAILWMHSHDAVSARRRAAIVGRWLAFGIVMIGVLEFMFGLATGLWTAMVGLLLVSMARQEETQSEIVGALTGVRVRDVMSPDVETVPAAASIDEFMHGRWMATRRSSLPVVDRSGLVVGLISWRMVATVPARQWSTTPVAAVAAPARDAIVLASPDDALVDALESRVDQSARIVAVEHGEVVGIVSPSDVARAVTTRRGPVASGSAERLWQRHVRGRILIA